MHGLNLNVHVAGSIPGGYNSLFLTRSGETHEYGPFWLDSTRLLVNPCGGSRFCPRRSSHIHSHLRMKMVPVSFERAGRPPKRRRTRRDIILFI